MFVLGFIAGIYTGVAACQYTHTKSFVDALAWPGAFVVMVKDWIGKK